MLPGKWVSLFSVSVLIMRRKNGGYGLGKTFLLDVLEFLAAGGHHLVGRRGEGIVSSGWSVSHCFRFEIRGEEEEEEGILLLSEFLLEQLTLHLEAREGIALMHRLNIWRGF